MCLLRVWTLPSCKRTKARELSSDCEYSYFRSSCVCYPFGRYVSIEELMGLLNDIHKSNSGPIERALREADLGRIGRVSVVTLPSCETVGRPVRGR